jgi:hypothetical protein
VADSCDHGNKAFGSIKDSMELEIKNILILLSGVQQISVGVVCEICPGTSV